MLLTLLAPLPLLVSAGSGPEPTTTSPPSPESPTRHADTLLLRSEDTLAELVDRLVELLGVSITFDSVHASSLSARSCGLLLDREVPVGEAPLVIEGLLALHGFTLVEAQTMGSGPPVLVLGSEVSEPRELITVSNTTGHGEHAARRVRVRRSLDTRSSSQLRATLRPLLGVPIPTLESDRSGEHLDGGVVIDGLGTQVADLLEVIDFFDSEEPPKTFGTPASSLLPAATGALELAPNATLLDVVRAWAARLDAPLAATAPALFTFEETRLADLAPRVPAEDVHAFVGGLLDEHGIATSLLGPPDARVLGLETLRGSRHLPVSAASPEALRAMPSLQLLVGLQVEALDVRRIPVELRGLVDPDRRAFLIAASPERIVIGGWARDVATLWDAVQRMERDARRAGDDPDGR